MPAGRSLVTEGPSANVEIRQYGMKTRWIVRVCKSHDLTSVEERYGLSDAREESDGTIVVNDPEYGTVHFRGDGSIEAEGRTITRADYSIKGEAKMLDQS